MYKSTTSPSWRGICLLGALCFIVGAVTVSHREADEALAAVNTPVQKYQSIALPAKPVQATPMQTMPAQSDEPLVVSPVVAHQAVVIDKLIPPSVAPVQLPPPPPPPVAKLKWHAITVQQGDNLALIFKRQRLATALHHIVNLDEQTKKLKKIRPGEKIKLLIDGDQLSALKYDINATETLYIKRTEKGQYRAHLEEQALAIKEHTVTGTIKNSLFLAARDTGLPDKLIMELVDIYAWDIDFVKDVRSGDRFYVIYQAHYKEDKLVKEGPILAAEFVNQGRSFRAVRYTDTDGHAQYYTPEGNSMHQTFLRTPVKFTRISSLFDRKRRHPILNTIRAHRGVDYAAEHGTPVHTTGDGVIDYVGRKGGYGKTVIIRHGERYTTLYGHLSSYAPHIKKGRHVKQGQRIGAVGSTGLSTGPHLHYEFRIDGVHHDPLRVKLPKTVRIPDSVMPHFKTQTAALAAKLGNIADHSVFVLNEEGTPPNPAN